MTVILFLIAGFGLSLCLYGISMPYIDIYKLQYKQRKELRKELKKEKLRRNSKYQYLKLV